MHQRNESFIGPVNLTMLFILHATVDVISHRVIDCEVLDLVLSYVMHESFEVREHALYCVSELTKNCWLPHTFFCILSFLILLLLCSGSSFVITHE